MSDERATLPEQYVLLPDGSTECPECRTLLQRIKLKPLTWQAVGQELDAATALDVQTYNIFATNYDAMRCESCSFEGYVRNADLGIVAGGGYKMRFSTRCAYCVPAREFDDFDEFYAHLAANVHDKEGSA